MNDMLTFFQCWDRLPGHLQTRTVGCGYWKGSDIRRFKSYQLQAAILYSTTLYHSKLPEWKIWRSVGWQKFLQSKTEQVNKTIHTLNVFSSVSLKL